MWAAMLDVSVYPFRTSNRADVERAYQTARASIDSPMSVREAWTKIAPVFGALNDGHVSLAFPGSALNEAAYRFPVFFALSDTDDSLIVAADRTATIPSGSKVLAVDGVDAATFKTLTLAAFGGQTRTLQRWRVTASGSWAAIALCGDRPSYSVQYSIDGKTSEAVVSSALSKSSDARRLSPYTYSTLADGTIGYINYRSCEDIERFRAFVSNTCRTIKTQPVRALIIDIRQNGGGDSSLNDVLWSYVAGKPFKQYGGIIEKSCARLKLEYGKDRYIRVYGEEAWNAPDGTIFRYGMNPKENLVAPVDSPLHYTGPVFLLISQETFSSAMQCAIAAKDYGLATIVGEETGEPVNSTGELYGFTAPGTKLQLYLTTKYFMAPKQHPDGQGVIPDVIVEATEEDRAAGRDAVLEKAVALAAA